MPGANKFQDLLNAAGQFTLFQRRVSIARFSNTTVEGGEPKILFIGAEEWALIKQFAVVEDLERRVCPEGVKFRGLEVVQVALPSFVGVGFRA